MLDAEKVLERLRAIVADMREICDGEPDREDGWPGPLTQALLDAERVTHAWDRTIHPRPAPVWIPLVLDASEWVELFGPARGELAADDELSFRGALPTEPDPLCRNWEPCDGDGRRP